jgi:uronate dehydrogenase
MNAILITGASGKIGGMLRARLARPGRALRLLDVVQPAAAAAGEAVEVLPAASVTDAGAVRRALDGVDAVIHLGGIPVEDTWENILSVNIDGTRTILEQARLAGVTRVVLASSNHAVGFAARADWPDGELPAGLSPRPDTYYGVSKAAMEALGSLYASRFGMDVICLRIGTCEETPPDTRALSTWLSADDMARLAEAAISAQSPGFRIVWGISRNTRRWWSLAEGEAIGYHPQDDAESCADKVPVTGTDATDRAAGLIGGMFCNVPLGEPM